LRPGRAGCPRCPYTTLFRSFAPKVSVEVASVRVTASRLSIPPALLFSRVARALSVTVPVPRALAASARRNAVPASLCETDQSPRSEEHTAELQSREKLVCRL